MTVGACGGSGPDPDLADYLTRVQRVTGVAAEPAPAEPRPRLPDRRSLTLEIPRQTVDVAEFFELHGCDMGALVGFRNSPLGRLQTASQRFGYEAAWLAAAERCRIEDRGWLDALIDSKRVALPALFWNATFAADEMRVALGAAAPAAGDDLADVLRGLGDVLTRAQSGAIDTADLEAELARLRSGSWLGPARVRWSAWRRYLDAVAEALREAGPRLCLNSRSTPQSRRLGNVFGNIYVARVQPRLAGQLSRDAEVVRELERLTARLEDVQPDVYRRWAAQVIGTTAPASEWQQTRQAVIDHAQAWQALTRHCDLEAIPALGQD